MAKDWWESYAPATESKDNWWSGYAVEDAARRELPEGVKPSEAGGGRGSAPASAYVRPPEAAPVARAETPPAAAEYTDAMGNALGGAEMPYGMEPAPSVKSVLNTPQATRAYQEERLGKPGGMLRQEYIDSVRSSFANLPAEKRRDALSEMANGTDAQAQAAQRLLADVQAEDVRNKDLSQGREGMIGLIANAARTAPSIKKLGTEAPALVTFPDVSQKPFDVREDIPESQRVDKALRLDEATRGVVQADTGLAAMADKINLASQDLSAEAFAKENPVLGALASGSGQIVSGLANAIPTMVDFAAKTVNLLSGGQLEPEGFNVRAPTYDWADRLAVSAKSAMPEAGKQNLASAVSKGEFASWLGLNLTAQAPQMVGNFIAALAPVTRPFMLPAMGAQTAGQAYGEGDSSLAAVLKGGAEILGEKATLGIFDHSFSALSKLPLSLQAPTVQSVGRALAATGKVVTAQAVAGSIEEATTQIFQNGVDKFVEGKNVGLLDQVTDAAVLGAFMQGPLAIPQTVKAFQGGAGAFGEAFAQDVAGAQYAAPADVVARRLLDVQSYDTNIITPQQTAKMAQAGQAFGKATSAEDVVAAANLMAGSVDELLVPNTIVPPTAAAPTLPEVTAPTELPPIPGLPAAPAPAVLTELPPVLGLPAAPAPAALTELPPVPGLPAAAAPAPLPAVNPETEKLFGLDKLRLNAPRPQSIQGEPVANLTDDKLTEIVNDESAHAMTRRGAAVELTARQAEQAPAVAPIEAAPIAAPTPVVEAPPAAVKTMTPAELGQMRLGDRRTLAREFDQTENDDGSITFTPKLAAPSAVALAAPETNFGLGAAQGRVSDAPVTGTGDTARADLQARLDETAAKHGIEVPVLGAPAKSDEAAVTVIGKALGLSGPVVAFSQPGGVDGFALGGAVAVNTSTQKGVAHTAWHENFHIAENIAAADTEAGRTDTPAQQYVTSIHGLFDDMHDAGKRAYVENFLHKDELASIADPVAREQRLQQLLSGQTLRSEMSADFMGNRATDRDFLAGLAKADPKGFGGFVQKWIGILDNMLVRLRGVKDKTELESVKVDSYLKDLNQAKMVARDAMVAFRNGTLQQSAPATAPLAFSQQQGETNERINVTPGGEVAPGLAGTAGQIPALGGGGEIPSYGTAREGAVSVVGRHYSATSRQSLSGAYYGRGLKGAEATRLEASTDPRLKNRVYFYADQGAGIRPESGVGGHAHEVQLNNIYDPASRLIKPQVDANAFESAVINAGFDGYMAPFGNNQSAVVLLGQKHKAVPVRAIGQPLAAAAPQAAAPTTLTKGLLSREANAIDVGNIPGAQVRMGNLQIPAGQTEAANVELARIGSDVRFAKKQAAPARVMFEVAPDPNNTELKARWDAVPFERKTEISQRVAKQIMPQVFKLAGVRAKLTTQLGGYLADTSPSFAAIVPNSASAQQLMDVAHVGGFGLAQDSMMVLDSKPFEGSFSTGLITITLPENMQDQDSVHSVYQAVRELSPENISGHTTVGQEMVLAVPSDTMVDLTSKIGDVLSARPETFGLDSAEGHMAFPSKEEYDYGKQTGELAPELSAKRAEASRIREEASAAIESELATDESAGGRQIDTGVYRSIADAMGLSQAEYNASALPLMLGGTGDKTFRAPNIGGVPEVVEWLDQRRAASGLPNLDINKPEDRTVLAKLLASEAVAAIRSAGNAMEWYDETVAKTLRIMAVKYPELNTDQNARNAFLMAVAISSQTMNVEDNLRYASSQYEAFRNTGKFPEVGTGKSAPAMGDNFKLANKILAEFGPEKTRQFLQTEFTKRELEMIGYSIGGESMAETMLGSAVFGPKIGFGFYSNLTGNFEPVTMDMWFMRTVGRLAGTLPAFDPVLFPKQVAKLRAALAEKGPAERGLYADQFGKDMVKAAMKTDEGAIALARAVNSLHNRQFIKERAAFDSGARIKSSLVGASGAILKSADKPTDAPSSGGERQRLRDVVRQMVAMVEKETGKRVPPAALQALIWYPEQELYKKLGVRLRVTSQDYAGAAKSLLTKEGFDGKRISSATKSGPRPTRQVAGQPDSGKNGPNGKPVERLVPLQGEERESFIRERTAKIAADAVKAQPLEDIFTGLDKRGMAKAKAETAFTSRPDGAQIKFVQDNFLDILAELDDSGLVKINCD